MAKRSRRARVVPMVTFPTPALFRWFKRMISNGAATDSPEGYVVHDEGKWSEYLRSAEGVEK